MRSVTQLRKASLCLVLAVTGLQACSPRPIVEQQFNTYEERIATVLEVSPPTLSQSPLSAMATKHLKISLPKLASEAPLPSQNLSLREFHQLPGCQQLKPIVAERNSSLGRVQSPSQQYLYQVKILSLLKRCLANSTFNNPPAPIAEKTHRANSKNATNKKAATNPKLAALYKIKLNDLNNSRDWFLIAEPIIRQNLQQPAKLLSPNWKQHQQTQTFWQSLTLLPNSNSEFPVETQLTQKRLNAALKNMEQNPLPARLYNTLHLYSYRLEQINNWLSPLIKNEKCDTPKSKKRAEYLTNIFNLYFIDQIQKRGGKLTALHYGLHPILIKLYGNIGKKKEIDLMLSIHKNTFNHYQKTIKSHTKIWNSLFKQCNKSPIKRV